MKSNLARGGLLLICAAFGLAVLAGCESVPSGGSGGHHHSSIQQQQQNGMTGESSTLLGWT